MKKLPLILALLSSFLVLLAGCASTKIALVKSEPLAIVSVLGNKSVPWVAEDPDDDEDGILMDMINKFVGQNNPEIALYQDRIDYAEGSLRSVIEEITGCKVLDKDDVVKNPTYERLYGNLFGIISTNDTATDYKDMSLLGKKNARILMKDIGANGLIFAEFRFQKELLQGNKVTGRVRAKVTMKIRVMDSTGKEIINDEFVTTSVDSVPMNTNKYNKNEFVELIPGTIDAIIAQFAVKYIGE